MNAVQPDRRRRGARAAALLAALVMAIGCAAIGPGRRPQAPLPATPEALAAALAALGPETARAEAERIAHTALETTAALAQTYRVVPPALFHNLLIQAGLRERGLCYHWTEDLMRALAALDLRSFELHWAVAYRGSDLREHNSVVVAPAGAGFGRGLVLDPWRRAGELTWAPVGDDEYPWEELPREAW